MFYVCIRKPTNGSTDSVLRDSKVCAQPFFRCLFSDFRTRSTILIIPNVGLYKNYFFMATD